MKRIIVGILLLVLVTLSLVGCGGGVANDSNDYSSAITLVQDSMSNVPSSEIPTKNYDAAELEEGVAVLVNDLGAYWVKDGVTYAANGIAKTWSPDLDYSPTGIDFDTIQDSINK